MNFFLTPTNEPAGIWDLLSRASDILSIISFVMTLILLTITRSIRHQFISRIRLPDLNKTLGKLCKEISGYDIGTSIESDIQKCLGQTKAKLKEAQNILPRSERKPFKVTIKEIESLMRSPLSQANESTKNLYWKMYGHLNECHEIISRNCNIARQA